MLARFDIAGDGAAKAKAATLKARIAGWTYRIGAWKQIALVPSLTDLESKPDKAAPASGVTQ